MTTQKLLAGLSLAVFFSGCQAHMMETRGDAIYLMKAPSQKPGRGGVIRYLNTGLASWRRSRRQDAFRQMKQFCGGPSTITAEGPRSQFGAKMPIPNHVTFEVDEYWYIAFDCERFPAPSER